MCLTGLTHKCVLNKSPVGQSSWSGGWHVDCGLTGWPFESALSWSTLTFPPVVHDLVNKGLGMSIRVSATGHIKDPMPLIEKNRASCPSGRFPPSFIHQVFITSGLNKLYECVFLPGR